VRLDWETRASLRLRQELRQLHDSHLTYDLQSITSRLMEHPAHGSRHPFHDVSKAKLPGSQILTSVVEAIRCRGVSLPATARRNALLIRHKYRYWRPSIPRFVRNGWESVTLF